MRGAVFDLDGTLADTAADLIGGANAALAGAGAGRPLDPARHAGLAGRGGRAMLAEGFRRARLPEAEIAAAVEAAFGPFLGAYEARIAEESRLFEGVEAALDLLAAGGWRLAVCTNKPERLARVLLGELGALERFAAVVGADTLPVRKPDPAPFRHAAAGAGAAAALSVMIGDTATDRETARAAGAPSVLMDLGRSADDVRALGADLVLERWAELPGALSALAEARGWA